MFNIFNKKLFHLKELQREIGRDGEAEGERIPIVWHTPHMFAMVRAESIGSWEAEPSGLPHG